MTSDKGVVERLLGADPDHVSPIDALRLHDQDSVTFPLSAEDVEGVLDLVDEAAARIETLERALMDARIAIASLTEDALGYFEKQPHHHWPLRDELLSKIDAALSPSTNTPEK